MRVLFCVYLNLFLDIFYLQHVLYLRDVSVTCVMFLCLIVFTWACPSVSCRLWIFSMGRICMSILTRVIHVRVIFSFLVGRHFGLVGIEAFVEGLGFPLTWSMAVLDVLLLLFSMCFLNIKSSLISRCNFFRHLLCGFMHNLCTFCALFMCFLKTYKECIIIRIKSAWGFDQNQRKIALRVWGRHKKSNLVYFSKIFLCFFFFNDFDLWIGKHIFCFFEYFMKISCVF